MHQVSILLCILATSGSQSRTRSWLVRVSFVWSLMLLMTLCGHKLHAHQVVEAAGLEGVKHAQYLLISSGPVLLGSGPALLCQRLYCVWTECGCARTRTSSTSSNESNGSNGSAVALWPLVVPDTHLVVLLTRCFDCPSTLQAFFVSAVNPLALEPPLGRMSSCAG